MFGMFLTNLPSLYNIILFICFNYPLSNYEFPYNTSFWHSIYYMDSFLVDFFYVIHHIISNLIYLIIVYTDDFASPQVTMTIDDLNGITFLKFSLNTMHNDYFQILLVASCNNVRTTGASLVFPSHHIR